MPGKLKLEQVGKNEWKFIEGREMSRGDMAKLEHAARLIEKGYLEGAVAGFIAILEELPHTSDAVHDIATMFYTNGMNEEALALWKNVVYTGRSAFPDKFKTGSRLEWGWLENRPFLRACHGLGLALMKFGKIDEALSVFNEILSWNPNDNQGVRALVIQCNFMLKRPESVLGVCSKYKGDGMVEIIYGKALALLQIGRMEEAKAALREAVEDSPKVAKELVKPEHTKPKGMSSEYITVGGYDEAYDYWKEQGRFWSETDGALEIIKHTIAGKSSRNNNYA